MKKILIVEDDQNIAKALAIRLKAAGYEITVSPDAMTAVAAAVKIQPDLALLDISVPAGNGFTVAEKIQELVATATPIIFLTASKQPGLRQKARELGAAGFFEKPYEAQELLTAIRRALGENEASRTRQPSDPVTVLELSP
jgi:DNA-binding response OmpR family regulator